MHVDIWSDVVCPWCYIGKRRFEKAIEIFHEEHPDVEVNISYRAFQLDPTAKAGEHQPVREAYEKKFGGPEAASQILERVTSEAAGEGIEFNMDIALRANTALAHRLLVLGEQRGLQSELKERLMVGYFTNGEAIGDPEVLIRIAEEVGIDAEEARSYLSGDGGRQEVGDQLMFAADAGISSVPTFVFNGSQGFSGAHPVRSLVKVLKHQAQSTQD
jgi:predicted DsbA family dithiol-disulfide isomerase